MQVRTNNRYHTEHGEEFNRNSRDDQAGTQVLFHQVAHIITSRDDQKPMTYFQVRFVEWYIMISTTRVRLAWKAAMAIRLGLQQHIRANPGQQQRWWSSARLMKLYCHNLRWCNEWNTMRMFQRPYQVTWKGPESTRLTWLRRPATHMYALTRALSSTTVPILNTSGYANTCLCFLWDLWFITGPNVSASTFVAFASP